MVDALGLVFVVASLLTFGSFGVFIKTPAIVKANVHPLIFQTYKTTAVFVTSWLSLIINSYTLTYWGFIGALLWVPAGISAVAAVRLAGLGISQGLWSGISVLVSFLWGTVVFGEAPKNIGLSIVSILLILAGIGGMTWSANTKLAGRRDSDKGADKSIAGDTIDREEDDDDGGGRLLLSGAHDDPDGPRKGCRNMGRKIAGLMFAVMTGVISGTMYVPLHYAGKEAHGFAYLVPFGVGALSVNCLILISYRLYCAYAKKTFPSFQVRVTLVPGLAAGTLWAAGNAFAIGATLRLGQAVGATAVQVQLLVAGLWGIFWYKEIHTKPRIASWFASAIVTIAGVILLYFYG